MVPHLHIHFFFRYILFIDFRSAKIGQTVHLLTSPEIQTTQQIFGHSHLLHYVGP